MFAACALLLPHAPTRCAPKARGGGLLPTTFCLQAPHTKPATQVTRVPERFATATLSCHPACRSGHAAAAAVAARNWRDAHNGTASRYPGAGRPRRLGSRRFRTPMPLAPRAVRFRGQNHSCVGGRARIVAGGGRRGVACESRWHRRHFASAVQPHSSSGLVHWDCLNPPQKPSTPVTPCNWFAGRSGKRLHGTSAPQVVTAPLARSWAAAMPPCCRTAR